MTRGARRIARYRWAIAGGLTAFIVGYCIWLVVTDAPAYQFLVRLYVDPHFLKQTLHGWGIFAPVAFIALQAVIAPIPGEVTGMLGGFLFGEWLGLIYSTIGLTLGSVAAFGVGRWLGAHYVRTLVSQETWDKMGFIVEAEGAILCFIIFLIPGLPKDLVCYLFGESHAVLGLRRRFHPWPHSCHLATVRTRRPYSSGRLFSGHPSHSHCRGRRATALSLQGPGRRMARRENRTLG